ncbi:MAG: maltotriose-binding protein, partial [Chloroflexota bacterium]
MTNRRHLVPILLAVSLAVGLAGCQFPSAQPPVDQNATAAAQTIAAQLTALALTSVPPVPTTAAPPPTIPELATATPSPTLPPTP